MARQPKAPPAPVLLEAAASVPSPELSGRIQTTFHALTEQEKRFVLQYLVTGNLRLASVHADLPLYMGRKLLEKPLVKRCIQALDDQRITDARVTAKDVLVAMKQVAFADPADCLDQDGNLLPLHEMPDRVRMAISDFDVDAKGRTTKVRLVPREKALLALGKHLNLFTDRLEVDLNRLGRAELEVQIAAAVAKAKRKPEET